MIETIEVEAIPEATPSDILRNAARYIEEHGWTQGVFFEEDDSACALGAIMAVAGGWTDQGKLASEQLAKYLHFSSGGVVAVWNDTNGRTREEVLAALRGAAE